MSADFSTQSPAAALLLDDFDIDRVRDDLTHLCADGFSGRRIGTPGHDRARGWLTARFVALGLETTTFEFTLDTSVLDTYATPSLVVAAAGSDQWQVLEHRRDFSEHPRSANHPGPIAGVAVDMQGAADRDGAWVILEKAPQGDALAAVASDLASQGAVGLLAAQHAGPEGYLAKRIVASPAVSLPILAVRTGLLPTLAGQRIRATAPVCPIIASGGHVLGRLAGAEAALSDAPLVIGAHYDGVGDDPATRIPGAADNAAAVAVVLELARLLAGASRRPRRSIVFAAFDAEEVNALGSRAHAQALARQHVSPLVLNLDGAARFNDAVWVEAGPAAGAMIAALDQAGRSLGIPLVMGPVGSDNRRYAGQGFPAVGLGLGGSGSHTPADVPERVDAEALLLAGALLLDVARRLAF